MFCAPTKHNVNLLAKWKQIFLISIFWKIFLGFWTYTGQNSNYSIDNYGKIWNQHGRVGRTPLLGVPLSL